MRFGVRVGQSAVDFAKDQAGWIDAPLSMQITKSLIARAPGLRGRLNAPTVNRFDPGDVQWIAVDRVSGNILARLG